MLPPFSCVDLTFLGKDLQRLVCAIELGCKNKYCELLLQILSLALFIFFVLKVTRFSKYNFSGVLKKTTKLTATDRRQRRNKFSAVFVRLNVCVSTSGKRPNLNKVTTPLVWGTTRGTRPPATFLYFGTCYSLTELHVQWYLKYQYLPLNWNSKNRPF